MKTFNTSERNIQIVLYLLKANGIKRIIASPGSTDVAIVASMQQDPFFEMYSAVDERSACYMACGLVAQTGEPAVIVCTGATSSRNYLPGLTEAYYRHLPVLAITCCKSNAYVGHYVNQVTDRSNIANDAINESVYVQSVRNATDEWDCMIKANRAILGLTRNGGGPCHINLETVYAKDFSVKEIPPVRVIQRYTINDTLPPVPGGKIGIFVGNLPHWPQQLTEYVDRFCEKYDAVVFYDQTSNYRGKYGVLFPLLAVQEGGEKGNFDIDVMIHIGYISAVVCKGKTMWRVNADGEIRDPFQRMTKVFQMDELSFFRHYAEQDGGPRSKPTLYLEYQAEYRDCIQRLPEIPYSNIWVASQLAPNLPENSAIHFGICNSLRSWNFFEIPKSVEGYSNTGGFGIDGGMSSLIGASLADRNKLFFGVFGDLLFFYDMNSLGNRELQANVRILVINNGLGQEFKNKTSYGAYFGEDTDAFIAAKGHYASRQTPLIRNYAENLGFEYLSASNKEEFLAVKDRFITPEVTDRPMLFEVYTETEDETAALEAISSLIEPNMITKGMQTLMNSRELAPLRRIVKKVIK